MNQWPRVCCVVLCLFGSSALAEDTLVDSFDYANASSAAQSWRAVAEGGDAVPLRVVQQDGRGVLELPTPFATHEKIGRVYMDRDVRLNLSAAGEFHLEVCLTDPQSQARMTLYFRSGGGWYGAGHALAGEGWNTLRFSKAAFSVEGDPAGWHQVDGIRIAVWRGQARDSAVRLRQLEARQHDVALVVPSGASSERRTARETAADVAEMLAELGLGSDAVDDVDLVHGALGQRQVAILAYNPGLSGPAVEQLVQFVQEGGKLLVCYQLPAELGAALGFGSPQYHRPAQPGQFAEIRLDAADIKGLPAAVKQASWNITSAVPTAYQARVIGQWVDAQGKATGLPALLISDRGAFFSHIILRDDREKKKQMLAAVLGQLAPKLWRQMADNALVAAGQVGHLADYESLESLLIESSQARVRQLSAAAVQTRQEALQCRAIGEYARVVELAGRLHEQLVEAYLLVQPAKEVEGRAIWNHSGTGAYDGDWPRTARELSEAGFNMVLPNMLWGGRAHYASDVLPRSRTFQQYGDQIAQCVAACKPYGIEVHVWKVNWNLSGAPPEFVAKIRREHRNQVSNDGAAHDWLCPSHPENFQLELDSMLEVARKYEVDGLHFDYIRYPDHSKCYCDGCRERFETQRGQKVANWPRDCFSGPLSEEYGQWRCDQITRLVKAVHEQAKEVRPGIEISAAVFGAYPSCKASVAQDWVAWVEAGYLDFICPMDYTENDQAFVNLVTSQLEYVDGRIPVYPGIGQWRLSDDRTVGQIHYAQQLGAPGFTIFNLTAQSIQSAVAVIGRGPGRERARTGR